MWFGGRRKAHGVGVVVLAASLSLALAGCGTGSTVGGPKAAEKVLPPVESMPAGLKTVAAKPSGRPLMGKSVKKCAYSADSRPSDWCKTAVAEGDASYGSDAGGKQAYFRVVVYRSESAAKRAFGSWESSIRSSSHKYRVLNGEKFGSESVTFVGAEKSSQDTQEVDVREGQFIGTVEIRGIAKPDAVDPTLSTLSKMFVDRMQKEG
ncbi:hypothetical protein ACFVT2_33515 [Streptomyces sp. NPDC058000]|uniref:hypothetical protein n=1 Tax=Streptomyces sp. NPDC058000 TaxID=3346299 RepID=UPI0036E1DA63